MQKYIFALVICSTAVLYSMNDENKKTLVSIAPKCISFCHATINKYKLNMLRASKEATLQPFFEHQIQKHKHVIHKIEKALNSVNHEKLYNTIQKFINLTYGNSLLLPCMWPGEPTDEFTDEPTNEEITLIKKIKSTRKQWVPKKSY